MHADHVSPFTQWLSNSSMLNEKIMVISLLVSFTGVSHSDEGTGFGHQ